MVFRQPILAYCLHAFEQQMKDDSFDALTAQFQVKILSGLDFVFVCMFIFEKNSK